MSGPLPPAPCPRCGRPGVAADGYRKCDGCNLMLPDQPELTMIASDAATVWQIGKAMLEYMGELEKAVGRPDVLVSLMVICGWKLRHANVMLQPGVPLDVQLPALMNGYEKANRVIEERDRQQKERHGVN